VSVKFVIFLSKVSLLTTEFYKILFRWKNDILIEKYKKQIMKTNCCAIKSFTILFILISFFTPFNKYCFNLFSDDIYAESFRQASYSNLQYALILNENEIEDEDPDDDLSTCFCLTINHLNDIEINFLCKKYVSVKQILFSGKSSRSPPFI
jgi:hypothetical protein